MTLRSLLQHPDAREFLREFQEEHLSEIEFLLGQRQRGVRSPESPWLDIADLERRIDAHADAMRAGGAVALELAREAMAGGDEAQVLAGAHVITSFQEKDGADGLGEALHALEESAADLLPVWEEVLVLSEAPRVAERVSLLLTAPRSEVRATAARILGRRHEGHAERILPLLDDEAPEARDAAVMALARLGHRPAVSALESLLQDAPISESEPLSLAALLLGSPLALRHCRRVCQSDGEIPSRFPRLLAMAGAEQDFTTVQTLCGRPELAPHAIAAVGILGIPSSIPFLVEQLSSEARECRMAAGAALNLLTGANLYVTERALEEGAEGDEPGRVVRVPNMDVSTWVQWWGVHEPRFADSRRFRRGKPFSLGVCVEELADPDNPFEVRERAAQELRIHSGQAIGFEADWPIRRQRPAIARWQQWWTTAAARGRSGGGPPTIS